MAHELADHIITSEVLTGVELACEKAVIEAVTKRNRPSRRRVDFAAIDAFLAPYEARLRRGLNSVWAEQRRTILSNMKRTPGPIGARSLAASRTKGLTFAELLEQWMFAKGPADKAIQVVYRDLALKLLVASGKRATTQAPFSLANPLSTNWDVFNTNIEKWLKTYSIDLADEINTVTLDKLKASLFEGWEAGESIPDLSNRVRDLYEEFDKSRADTIARTETQKANDRANEETWKASGVVDRSMWIIGPEPCPICEALDGEVRDLGDDFYPPDEYSDGSGPPRHPRCVCARICILSGENVDEDGNIE
jgi:SPP1 gp7 family putative phage head morphogenesis protein